jgi:hypothetical protein
MAFASAGRGNVFAFVHNGGSGHDPAMAQQRVVLFRVSHGGMFGQKESNNLEELNALLAQGWRVVQMSPTSSPSVHVGAFTDVFALVVLEKN